MILGFNSNLHPAETVGEIVEGVLPFAQAVRAHLGWAQMGLDLRLGSTAIAELSTPARIAALRAACDQAGVVVATINAFPLRPFQQQVQPTDVYRPDWSEAERLRDTLALIPIVQGLMPGPERTISTLPLGWGPAWSKRQERQAAQALVTWAQAAAGTGVKLCLEPEPWCAMEHSAELIAFWQGPLRAAAGEGDLAANLGLCLDTCHGAVAGEDSSACVAACQAAGIPVPKCQVSSPLCWRPGAEDPLEAFARCADRRFAHQTRLERGESSWRAWDLRELAVALERFPQPQRIVSHFHVPLFWPAADQGLGGLPQQAQRGVRAAYRAGCRVFQVETYTWSVLAQEEADRVQGTARELDWLAGVLAGC